MRTSPDAYKRGCRALLKAFDKTNLQVEQTIDTAAAALEADLPGETLAELNDGQVAAVTDFIITHGIEVFQNWRLRDLLVGGNLTVAPTYLIHTLADNHRGAARIDVWNVGNSQ